MTVVEVDTRGIDALSDKADDSVEQLPALLFEQLMTEIGDQFPVAPLSGPDLEFDDEPWRKLPDMQALKHLWATSPPLVTMMQQICLDLKVEVEDLPGFLVQQRLLADIELAWMKEKEAQNVHQTASAAGDVAGSEEPATVAAAASGGGGDDVSGEPEDGDQVGEGRQTGGGPDVGRPQKVPGRRRPGNAAKAARRDGTP